MKAKVLKDVYNRMNEKMIEEGDIVTILEADYGDGLSKVYVERVHRVFFVSKDKLEVIKEEKMQ